MLQSIKITMLLLSDSFKICPLEITTNARVVPYRMSLRYRRICLSRRGPSLEPLDSMTFRNPNGVLGVGDVVVTWRKWESDKF